MVMNYADPTALSEDAPAGALEGKTDEELGRLLTHASRLMRKATRRARYDTDEAGNPTRPNTIEAFRAATTAQVIMWIVYGVADDVLSGGLSVAPTIDTSSENGASIKLDNSTAQESRMRILSGGLAPEARAALDDEGLLDGLPTVRNRGGQFYV